MWLERRKIKADSASIVGSLPPLNTAGGWGSPRGENLEEPPDGNKDKESGLIRNIDGGFDENVLAKNYGRHAAAA